MRFSSRVSPPEQTKSPLTSFVDIVFLLLVFFVLTFRVVPPEGDFAMDWPQSRSGESNLSAVRVELRRSASAPEESLITWYDSLDIAAPVRSVAALNRRAWQHTQQSSKLSPGISSASLQVVLDVDPRLEYRHTIDALAALSARRQEGRRIVLFRNIALKKRPA